MEIEAVIRVSTPVWKFQFTLMLAYLLMLFKKAPSGECLLQACEGLFT